MAHYAFLDDNNLVTEVIVGVDEYITQTDSNGTDIGGSSEAWETWYGDFKGQVCRRTSYNGNYRKNYAGIGFTYDGTWQDTSAVTTILIGSYNGNPNSSGFDTSAIFGSWNLNL